MEDELFLSSFEPQDLDGPEYVEYEAERGVEVLVQPVLEPRPNERVEPPTPMGSPVPRRLARVDGSGNPERNHRFRVNATAVFLTYSQSNLARSRLVQYWQRQPRLKRVIIGQEHHQDGNLHWHVLVEWDHKIDCRSANHFDMDGEHPNIKTWDRATTYEQWLYNHWKYCTKEDPTPWSIGEPPTANRKRKRDDIAREAIEICRRQGVNEAMNFFQEVSAYDFLMKADQMYRTLTRIRNAAKPQTDARALGEFRAAPMLVDNWRCLYINGPTGTGKTAWARALLPNATVVRHRDQLRDCDFSFGVIFDDFDVGHWPPTAVIHLLDWDESSGIDVKHGHVVIPAHTRKIFTHNCSFERWMSKDATDEQVAACRRRIHVVNIHTSLF